MRYATFDEWLDSDDYRLNVILPFGQYGSVEAVAYIAWMAARKETEAEVYEKLSQQPEGTR